MAKNNQTKVNRAPAQPRSNETSILSRQEISFTAATTSGPIPDPRALEHYDKILPGAADRILTMAESESSHRREFIGKGQTSDIEAQQQELNIKNKRLNSEIAIEAGTRIVGFFVVALAILAGVYNELHGGSTWLSVTIAGIPTAAFVRQFFYRSSDK